MKSGWKKYLPHAGVVIVGGGLLFLLWETVRARNTGFETKTLWDWMDLLIVPLVLAGGALFLNRSERNTEREIATNSQQEAALQVYIDRMSELLLKEKLRTTDIQEVRDLARTRTLSILRVLDKRRSNLVFQFLREANLVDTPTSILANANLMDTELQGLNLHKVSFQGALLRGKNLQNAHLWGADFHDANLESANLNGVYLISANLSGAKLQRSTLQGAFLIEANLVRANLTSAHLQNTNLKDANFGYASLVGAELEGANLEGVNLEHANLNLAKVTEKQLAQAASLSGAIMPDGTKHL